MPGGSVSIEEVLMKFLDSFKKASIRALFLLNVPIIY